MALVLALEPLLPLRAPADEDRLLTYGYRLRLRGGPALAPDDALLAAHGARCASVHAGDGCEESLQDARFDPGRRLRLVHDPFAEDDPQCVRVWDAEGVLELGELPERAARVALAGIEHGLHTGAIVVCERRGLVDDRRVGVDVLVHAPSLVRVPAPRRAFDRPDRPSRRRVVLVADGRSDVGWWAASTEGGPSPVEELPVSTELAQQLRALGNSYQELGLEEEERGAFAVWERESLEDRARTLWRRARAELGRTFLVGYLGPNMRRPAWSPIEEPSDDELAFEDLFID